MPLCTLKTFKQQVNQILCRLGLQFMRKETSRFPETLRLQKNRSWRSLMQKYSTYQIRPIVSGTNIQTGAFRWKGTDVDFQPKSAPAEGYVLIGPLITFLELSTPNLPHHLSVNYLKNPSLKSLCISEAYLWLIV